MLFTAPAHITQNGRYITGLYMLFTGPAHTTQNMRNIMPLHDLGMLFTAPTHITQNVCYITGACSLQHLHKITQVSVLYSTYTHHKKRALHYRCMLFTAPKQNHTK